MSTSTNYSQSDMVNGDTQKEFDPSHIEDKIPSSPLQFQLPDLESIRSSGSRSTPSHNFPSPDPYFAASHDPEYQHLKENLKRLRKAPLGTDPKKVDATWDLYKRSRDECLQLCQSLLQKTQNDGRTSSFDANIGPLDTRSSHSGSVHESPLALVNEQWMAAIQDFKTFQERMLNDIRSSLVATYKTYEPDASEQSVKMFLSDKIIRRHMTTKWRDISLHAMKSEKLLFWEQYKIRLKNFDRLQLDLQVVEKLLGVTEPDETDETMVQEIVIAKTGDTILEFATKVSEVQPMLRFRVSSHLLAESSRLFAQMLSPREGGIEPPNNMIGHLPKMPPSKYKCKDGTEVKLYRMPQIEPNKHNALTILLHAAHIHHSKVPREIELPVFVSIAEVCLKYQCTSPLELQVEYRWLPQWIHMIADPNPDGLLLISYTFGTRKIFTRMTKTAIMNATSDAEIQSKEIWPQVVRDRIKAIRAAKFAQIYQCCTNAIEEYFRPPSDTMSRKTSVGSLRLSTTPRCPKGDHACDAANLGWLMLVFNELRVLPSIMKSAGLHNLPSPPDRSLKELLDCFRLVPSAPTSQVHSGVCDYAPAFRNAIEDIYNSMSGLNFRDVTGRNGWALSKDAGSSDESDNDEDTSTFELEAPSQPPRSLNGFGSASSEAVSLRILSHIDNIDDLSAAAMINHTFYDAYKRNEAFLLRHVMKADRRRTMSCGGPELAGLHSEIRRDVTERSRLHIPSSPSRERRQDDSLEGQDFSPRTLNVPQFGFSASRDHQYDVSPLVSPLGTRSTVVTPPMSAEEAESILWGAASPSTESTAFESRRSSQVPPTPGVTDRNEKFLGLSGYHKSTQRSSKDLRCDSYVEDKARFPEDGKHMREEKDRILRRASGDVGSHSNEVRDPRLSQLMQIELSSPRITDDESGSQYSQDQGF